MPNENIVPGKRLLARPVLVFILFLAFGAAIYGPAICGELVWDDHYLVGENPLFRSPVFAGEVFRHYLFFESSSTYYRPVQNLSYIADYWLWHGVPLGYHLTNLLLHVGAAWLLWRLLVRIWPGLAGGEGKENPWPPFLIALAWLVHPIHSAAVAYISGRADSLAAFFCLGAWLLWLRARESVVPWKKALLCMVAMVALMLGLCSKEVALVWLLLFAVHTIAFERGARRFLPLMGVVAALGIYLWLHSLPSARPPQPSANEEGLMGRGILALRAMGDYTRLMLFPARLMMERTLGPVAPVSREGWYAGIGAEWLSILGFCAVLGGVLLTVHRGAGQRVRVFGALWFLIAFIPISNLIPLNAEVAEHWIYLASIGFLILLAGTAALLPAAWAYRTTMVALLACAALAGRAYLRAGDWVDAETFARKTLASGGVTARMLAYLAQELGQQGRLKEQESIYRKAMALFPDYTAARVNLALCLQKQGRDAEAKALFQAVVAPSDTPAAPANTTAKLAQPRSWNAALNLAAQHEKAGRTLAAQELIAEWRERYPDTWELAAYEAQLRASTESPAAARDLVAKYAQAHWWHLPSHLGLASFQRETGQFDAALATLDAAERLDIHGSAVHAERAQVLMDRGDLKGALESQATAISKAPEDRSLYGGLAAVLQKMGRTQEAEAALRKARQ